MAYKLPMRLGDSGPAIESTDPEAAIRHRSRFAAILIISLLVIVVGSMTFIPIGGAVIAGGQVGVESRVKRIAHPVGGIIAEVFVANGDHVLKGAALMRFDDNVTGAQSALSSLTVTQLLAQRARLDAERLGLSHIAFPQELLGSGDPGARRAMADESRLFSIRRSEAGRLRSQLAARMTQYSKQIAGYNAQINALRKQQALIQPEREGVQELWEKDLVTISRRNQLERSAVDMDGSIASLEAQIAQTQARITETSEQLIQLGETRRAEAGVQAATIGTTLNEQQVRSVSAGDLQSRTVLRAPYDGVIDKMAFTAVGDVIRPAETIMEIVPDRDKLVLEIVISPSDIDQIRAGQPARIRFTAFNSTATPDIGGTLSMVAAERTNNPDSNTSYYQGRVEVDAADLKRYPELKLKPGMPAEVFIETGSRSMISYIIKPLRDQLARAFRDN